MALLPDSEAFGHKGRVFDLDFNPLDPACLASASEDGSVRVWRTDAHSSTWRQASCCFGHKDEVLRVAWSSDGSTLASGGADGTVRLWNPLRHGQATYAGQELMVLEGHPEEVYALTFIAEPSTTGPAAAPPPPLSAAAAARGLPPQQQQALEPLLVAGSGESLFLWDLTTQQLLQEAQPCSRVPHRPDWRPPVQPPPPGTAPGTAAAEAAAASRAAAGSDEEEEEEEDWAPSYVFSLAASPALQLLATSSSDGVVRLFEARPSSRCLKEVAAAQAYPNDMGTCCAFSSCSPHQLVTSSKGGEVLLLDIRQLAAPLQHMQLPGPVMDMAVACIQGGKERLLLVGCDAVVRSLCWHQGALSQWTGTRQGHWAAAAGNDSSSGQLQPGSTGAGVAQGVEKSSSQRQELLRAPGTYQGSLLAVAACADGSRVAAAGAAVELPAGPTLPRSSTKGSSSGGSSSAGIQAVTSGVSAMDLMEPTQQHTSTSSTAGRQQQQQQEKPAEVGQHAPPPAVAAAAAAAGAVRRRGQRPAAGANVLDATMMPGGTEPPKPGAGMGAAADDLFGSLDLLPLGAGEAAAALREQQHDLEHHPPDSSRAPLYMWIIC